MIGIVGGAGPFAGVDLSRKICEETLAHRDQDHVPFALLSTPGTIADRTAFLLGEQVDNPGEAIADVVLALERLGCTVVGLPCHTAHAPPIFDAMSAALARQGAKVRFVNMLEETARYLGERFTTGTRIGVLSTIGTQRAAIYPAVLGAAGFEVDTLPEPRLNELVHRAIYDTADGIKVTGAPVSARVRRDVIQAITELREAGAEAVVLGCTELPLAVPEADLDGLPIVDPTRILARALIRAVAPARLRPAPGPDEG
jgi:aspartate racemase